MKHAIRFPCKKCHMPVKYLRAVRHLVKTSPPMFLFYVECGCKPNKMYAAAEEAIRAFNKANAPAKTKKRP